MFDIELNEIIQKKKLSNQNLLIEHAKNKNENLLSRIEAHCRSDIATDISTEMIRQKIIEGDPAWCYIFRNNPTKQVIHEQFQLQKLKELKYPFIDYKQGRKLAFDTMYNIISITKKNKNTKVTKTFDYIVELNDYKVFGILKYTKDDGGSQDNQYEDVRRFVIAIKQHFNKYPNSSYRFDIFLDGSYYTQNRRDALKSELDINDNRIFFGSVKDLVNRQA